MNKSTQERKRFEEFQKKIYIEMIETDYCQLYDLNDEFISIMENGDVGFGIKLVSEGGFESDSFLIIEFENKTWKITYETGSYSTNFDQSTMVEVKPVERTIVEYQTV